MEHQRLTATCTPLKTGAATRKVSAQSAKGTRRKPAAENSAQATSDCLVDPDTAPREEQKCGPTRASGSQRKTSQRKTSTQGSQKRPQVRARATDKEPLNPEDFLDGLVSLAEAPAAPAPPLPRVGSRGKGSACSAGEHRPPPGTTVVQGHDPWVPARNLSCREGAASSWKPRTVLEKLKLSSQEISEASKVVNKVVEHLLCRLNSLQSEFKGVELLRTGSYYEQVKVSFPNEFDIMFKLDVPRIELEEYCGAYYYVKFKRNPKGNPLNQFLEKERLSASKMLSRFREIIKEEIRNIKDIDVIMTRKKRGSPAVTLLIKTPKEISVDIILALQVRSSWPASTKEGLPIKDWLGTKVRRDLKRQPYYLVPKHAKEKNNFEGETWRLSFSHIEKAILKNHGQSKKCCEKDGVKCCRKDCLKLMKYLLEQLKIKHGNQKKLDKFCSYHVKTSFFHVCSQFPDDNHWRSEDVELCFDRCLEYFLKCIKKEYLINFFIPEVNLFSSDQVDTTSKNFLLNQIEYEINNGFPVFKEF